MSKVNKYITQHWKIAIDKDAQILSNYLPWKYLPVIRILHAKTCSLNNAYNISDVSEQVILHEFTYSKLKVVKK